MRFPKITAGRAVRLGVAAAIVAGGAVGLAASGSYAAPVAFTLSSATGPGGTTHPASVLSVSGSGFKNATGTILVNSGAGGVQFQTATSCSSTIATSNNVNITYAAGNIVSATKLVFTISANSLALGTANASKAYMLCVYNTATTPALIGSAKYTVYPVPTANAISPTSGRSFGGTQIAISATSATLTAKTTATIGGAAVKDIKVASDGLSLTGTLPAGTAGAQSVVVTTEGGSVTVGNFTYTSAINVTPSVGPAAGGTVLDITGVGFNGLNFATTAAVVLTNGAYAGATDAVNNTTGAASADTIPDSILGTCTGVQVVSDTELTCTAPAMTSAAYSVVVVANKTVVANTTALPTAVTSGATFTYAAF